MNPRGSAATILLVLVAIVACAVGALAAFALRGANAPSKPVRAPAPEVLAVGGGGAATPSYMWLDRSQDLLALSRGGAASGQPGVPQSASSPETDEGPTITPAPPADVTAPKVIGKSYEEAGATLQGAGLSMELKGKRRSTSIPVGRIATQWPDSGASVAAGSTVAVTKSLGPPPPPKKKAVRRTPSRRKRSSGGGCSGDCSRCHPGR